jgi:hypothetical protein
VVEHLPRKHEALTSNPSGGGGREREREREREGDRTRMIGWSAALVGHLLERERERTRKIGWSAALVGHLLLDLRFSHFPI